MKADLAYIHHSGLMGAPPLVTLTHPGAGLLLSIPPAASVVIDLFVVEQG